MCVHLPRSSLRSSCPTPILPKEENRAEESPATPTHNLEEAPAGQLRATQLRSAEGFRLGMSSGDGVGISQGNLTGVQDSTKLSVLLRVSCFITRESSDGGKPGSDMAWGLKQAGSSGGTCGIPPSQPLRMACGHQLIPALKAPASSSECERTRCLVSSGGKTLPNSFSLGLSISHLKKSSQKCSLPLSLSKKHITNLHGVQHAPRHYITPLKAGVPLHAAQKL